MNNAESRRFRLLDLPVDALSMEETLDWIEKAIAARKPVQHTVVNAAKVIAARTDSLLRASIEASDLVNVDGQAVVWAARALGVPVPERVAGIDLMQRLLERSAVKGYSVYLLGARRETLEALQARLRRELPRLKIAGARDGYFREDEGAGVADGVSAAKPDLLFVAMPTPRKERFIRDYLPRMGVPFSMGVGGSFDVLAGQVRRAPVWMQRAGLEWSYRLLQEPRRLFWRYALTNSRFVAATLAEVARARLSRRAS